MITKYFLGAWQMKKKNPKKALINPSVIRAYLDIPRSFLNFTKLGNCFIGIYFDEALLCSCQEYQSRDGEELREPKFSCLGQARLIQPANLLPTRPEKARVLT